MLFAYVVGNEVQYSVAHCMMAFTWDDKAKQYNKYLSILKKSLINKYYKQLILRCSLETCSVWGTACIKNIAK